MDDGLVVLEMSENTIQDQVGQFFGLNYMSLIGIKCAALRGSFGGFVQCSRASREVPQL